MKDYIIAFFIALVATSWVFTTGGPPQAVPVGVRDVGESTKRRTYEASDSTFDNFNLVDGPKDLTYMSKVVNKAPNTTTQQSLPQLGAGH
jgi:hypothetical protein